MVDINLEGPEHIKGYTPSKQTKSMEYAAGDHVIPVNFNLTVPEGQKYRVNLVIEVTGVL